MPGIKTRCGCALLTARRVHRRRATLRRLGSRRPQWCSPPHARMIRTASTRRARTRLSTKAVRALANMTLGLSFQSVRARMDGSSLATANGMQHRDAWRVPCRTLEQQHPPLRPSPKCHPRRRWRLLLLLSPPAGARPGGRGVLGQSCPKSAPHPALTKGHQQADEAGGRHVVEALHGVHAEALAVDEHLHHGQAQRLRGDQAARRRVLITRRLPCPHPSSRTPSPLLATLNATSCVLPCHRIRRPATPRGVYSDPPRPARPPARLAATSCRTSNMSAVSCCTRPLNTRLTSP